MIKKLSSILLSAFFTLFSLQAYAQTNPYNGILGATTTDLHNIGQLGAKSAQILIPATKPLFANALRIASAEGINLIISIDSKQIQNASLKFDLEKLFGLVNYFSSQLADSHVASLLLAADLCHIDSRGRKWNINSADLDTAIQLVNTLIPGLPISIDYSKSSCLDTFVSSALPGQKIGDIAILNFFYYKWSTTPNLLASYDASALNFKAFNPSGKVVPKIGVMETIGTEASAFPTTNWILDRVGEFFSYGSDFDGTLLYDYRPQSATETITISDVRSDPSYAATIQQVFLNYF